MSERSRDVGLAVLAGVLLVFAARPVGAAKKAGVSGEAAESGERRRVGVLSFDEGTQAGAVMETVSEVLNRAKYEVIAGDELSDLLRERQDGEVPKKVASQFAGIADEIGDGVKSFFYKGNETAVEELTPIFDLGMGHPEVLVRRPDFAEQIFQAGIVLVRSHRNLGNDGKAKAVARQLVRTLPGRDPSPSTAPPGTIRFFRDQREKLADEGTKIGVQKVGSDECTAYLNGTQVGTGMYVVAPGETYYLRLECGTAGAPVWRAKARAGEHLTVPISSESPLEYTMENGNFTNRKVAENYLRLVQYWTGLPQVLGIKKKTPGSSSDGVLVVRVDGDGNATWSDTQKKGEIRRAISRVMPEYRPGEEVGTTSSAARRDRGAGRWLDWTLLGAGTASLATGTVLTVITEQRAREVRCSPDTGATPDGCSGVEVIEFSTQSEIRQAEREVTNARIGYAAAYTVGAGLVTWGVWRLVSRSGGSGSATKSARRLRLRIAPRTDGASASLGLRW